MERQEAHLVAHALCGVAELLFRSAKGVSRQ
jgi:hypothetical protein